MICLCLFSQYYLSCLVVFNVPSTARSFRYGTSIYCPLRRTRSSINTPFRPGIEPRAVVWQSISLPLRYASSTSNKTGEHVRAATDESQKTLNKCETRNKSVFDTRLRHPETINSVPLNSVLRIKQTCV